VQYAVVDRELVEGDVEVESGRIAAVGVPGRGKGIAIPALIDLQINGYAGIDFSTASPAEYRHVERKLLADGVGSYLPTIITADEERMLAALRGAKEALATWEPGGSRPLGVHLEGPFLSPERPGVHPVAAMREPSVELADRLLEAGPVAFATVAPEREGALELITYLASRGVVVSCGHSDATYEEAMAGFDAGAKVVTHLFNTMRPIGHRDPGISTAALLREDVYLGLIADDDHLAPPIVELIRRLAPDRIYLVTDAVAGADAPDGVYSLGSIEVTRTGGRMRTEGRLAGGTTSLIDCARHIVDSGVVLSWAVTAASTVPARILKRTEIGTLRPGSVADVVVVDESLVPQLVLSGGKNHDA